ncbi:hypothetical protein RHS01_02747 [Rhizoctonia solani]|uniref:Uncharacterized protein n=1 Tax=Rhizoctonia solani TaxID=456999 RepID=A0A8H7M7P3_9AGAM|nr:hypothetical protein RHS01_02747 [Rhizoctonia solani]
MPMNTYPTFEPSLPMYEGTHCTDSQLRTHQSSMGNNNIQFGPGMFQAVPFEPILPGEWLTPDNFQWAPALNPSNTAWDMSPSSYSSSYSSSPGSSYDPFGLAPGFTCDASPEFEAYSPPAPRHQSAKSLPIVPPVVPSSSRESPPGPSRRARRPSKDSSKLVSIPTHASVAVKHSGGPMRGRVIGASNQNASKSTAKAPTRRPETHS